MLIHSWKHIDHLIFRLKGSSMLVCLNYGFDYETREECYKG